MKIIYICISILFLTHCSPQTSKSGLHTETNSLGSFLVKSDGKTSIVAGDDSDDGQPSYNRRSLLYARRLNAARFEMSTSDYEKLIADVQKDCRSLVYPIDAQDIKDIGAPVWRDTDSEHCTNHSPSVFPQHVTIKQRSFAIQTGDKTTLATLGPVQDPITINSKLVDSIMGAKIQVAGDIQATLDPATAQKTYYSQDKKTLKFIWLQNHHQITIVAREQPYGMFVFGKIASNVASTVQVNYANAPEFVFDSNNQTYTAWALGPEKRNPQIKITSQKPYYFQTYQAVVKKSQLLDLAEQLAQNPITFKDGSLLPQSQMAMNFVLLGQDDVTPENIASFVETYAAIKRALWGSDTLKPIPRLLKLAAYPTAVNNQITDSVPAPSSGITTQITDSIVQTNVEILGDAPGMAMGNLFIAISNSIAVALENSTNMQQQTIVTKQNVTSAITTILGIDVVSTGGTAISSSTITAGSTEDITDVKAIVLGQTP